jgi:hypothetical protein
VPGTPYQDDIHVRRQRGQRMAVALAYDHAVEVEVRGVASQSLEQAGDQLCATRGWAGLWRLPKVIEIGPGSGGRRDGYGTPYRRRLLRRCALPEPAHVLDDALLVGTAGGQEAIIAAALRYAAAAVSAIPP